MSHPRIFRWLAVLWAMVIFGLSSIPGKSLPELPALHFDKVIHALIYAVLGGLSYLGFPVTVSRRLGVLAAALLATLFGASDEFHQLFVAGRSADLLDLLADGVGSLLGAGSAALVAGMRAPT